MHSRSQPSVPPLNLRPSDVSFYDAHLEEHMAAVRAGEYGGHHSPMQKARARPSGPSAAALRSAQARHISPTRQRGASGRTSNEIHAFDNKSAAKRLVEAPWAASGRYESARNIFGAEYHIARRTGRLHD